MTGVSAKQLKEQKLIMVRGVDTNGSARNG